MLGRSRAAPVGDVHPLIDNVPHEECDQWDRGTLQAERNKRYPGNRRTALVLAALLPLACTRSGPVASGEAVPPCDSTARLEVELYGAMRESVRWSADTLACESMPRPGSGGARLRLSGSIGEAAESRKIAFILGIPDLDAGRSGDELPTNVTLLEEGTGRFFSTRDTSGCWTDIEQNEPSGPADEYEYRISGILYCVEPLAELNGTGSVTFTDMQFVGRINWKPTP